MIKCLNIFLILLIYTQAQRVTLNRIDARPSGHPLDSKFESDPIIDVPFMKTVGVLGASATTMGITGPSVILVPDWIPDAEKTHPDAVYYMYYAAHGSKDIRLAWAKEITGQWHLFNRGTEPDKAWGSNGNYSGTQTPGNGVLDLNLVGSDNIIWFDSNFGVVDHIASPDVFVDDVNEKIILYFHAPQNKAINLGGTGTFVATSKYGLNFNLPIEGGENFHGPRNVLVAQQYLKIFEVEGEENGQMVKKSFGFVNGSGLWAAPTFIASGEMADHSNADMEGGYWNPDWPGDPTPLPNPDKPFWWTEYQSWTDANPYHGTIKAPELVPPGTAQIVRQHNHGPRHFAIYHNNVRDRNKIYVMYTCRRDLPESIVLVTFDLTGLSETDRLNPTLWKRVSDMEQVLLKPELVWEGVEMAYRASASGAGHGNQFRDPDVFEDTDGKIYVFYCGKGEGNIGVAEMIISEESNSKSIDVTSPFKGYTYLIGSTRNISWDYTGDITQIDLEYTINGTDWISIANNIPNQHYHTWIVPNTPSSSAQIRIKESGGTIGAQSDPFMIATDKSLYIMRPKTGVEVLSSSDYGITWASVGNILQVDLEYTLNGTDWIEIVSAIDNSMTYIWSVPASLSSTVQVRVQETGGLVSNESEIFKIVDVRTPLVKKQKNYINYLIWSKIEKYFHLAKKINLYDLSGKKVREINSQNGKIYWDKKDKNGIPLKSGIYVAQIISDNEVIIFRFIVGAE